MKYILLTIASAMLGVLGSADASRANEAGAAGLGFLPYGLYQPYGIRYSTSIRTPPHFAVNPPVYYGHRYARPYGASPFASPPLLSAPASYRVSHAPQAVPPVIGVPVLNPYCGEVLPAPAGQRASEAEERSLPSAELPGPDEQLVLAPRRGGAVRFNPWVSRGE